MLALAGWSAVGLAEYGFDRLFSNSPPPLDVQLRDELARAAQNGYRPVLNRRLDFRGDGSQSRVIIFRRVRASVGAFEKPDELRIYESHRGRLEPILQFQPCIEASSAPESIQAGGNLGISVAAAGDLDGSGTEEVVFRVEQQDFGVPRLVFPLLLLWNFKQERYALLPLLSPRQLGRATIGLRSTAATESRGLPYEHRIEIRDCDDGKTKTGIVFDTLGTEALEVQRSDQGPLLVALFTSKEEGPNAGPLYQAKVWHLYPDGLGLALADCLAVEPPVLIQGETGRASSDLVASTDKVDQRFSC